MSRLAIFCALAVLLPATASAESYRAGPLGAWLQNNDFSCEGGDLLLFQGGAFAVIPRRDDERTTALIDSRNGRAKVGATVADDLERLKDDPAVCAGPIDCDDGEKISEAIQSCWADDAPINN